MKFTTEDFAPASLTTPQRPKQSPHVNIPCSNSRLPIRTPSPFFDGMNEDINTEPFPSFEDPLCLPASVSDKSFHCILHCDDDVYKLMKRCRQLIPPCRRGFEQVAESSKSAAEVSRHPPLNVEALNDDTRAQALQEPTSPDTKISIYFPEVLTLLRHLDKCTTTRALEDQKFMATMEQDFPAQKFSKAISAVDLFFNMMHICFSQPHHSSSIRVVTVKQLRVKLYVYIWTTLRDWVEQNCDDETYECILSWNGPNCIGLADSEALVAVLEFWQNSIDSVIVALVRRDEEVMFEKTVKRLSLIL